ncbi:MAG: PIG-L family deacetylase [Aquaticitalea sp.]
MSDTQRLTREDLAVSPALSLEQLGHQIGKVMVLAPHPDDEALGCGGLISHLRRQDIDVWICFMTSGEASHPNSKKYPSNVLLKVREMEALNSCHILGVDASKVLFMNGADGHFKKTSSLNKQKMVTTLVDIIQENDVATLFIPWRRDCHPDHLATFNLGMRLKEHLQNPVQIFEYPIWLWASSMPEDWPLKGEVELFRLNVEDVLEIKKEAIFAHTSQTTDMIDDDIDGFMLTTELLIPFLSSYEYFFLEPEKTKESLDKNYFDALYENNPDPWNFTNSEYEIKKYETIDSFLGDQNYSHGLELGCSIGIQTRFFANRCRRLLAVDISEEAIKSAESLNKNLDHVQFKVMDILKDFPAETFDFISMCEVGYFFSQEALKTVFQNITNRLENKGQVLLVHWTSYVRDFPLTGQQVHKLFQEHAQQKGQFELMDSFRDERYELMLWRRVK